MLETVLKNVNSNRSKKKMGGGSVVQAGVSYTGDNAVAEVLNQFRHEQQAMLEGFHKDQEASNKAI
jgi:hypothetical protein